MSPFISPDPQKLPVFVVLELPTHSTVGNGSSPASGTIDKSLLPPTEGGVPSHPFALWTRGVGGDRGPSAHGSRGSRAQLGGACSSQVQPLHVQQLEFLR